MAPSAITLPPAFDAAPLYLRKQPLAEKHFAAPDVGYRETPDAKALIGEALLQRVQSINPDTCDAGEEDSFFVADLGEVYRQHLRWKRNLQRIKPHYGKCFFSLFAHKSGCMQALTRDMQRSNAIPTRP